jgi:predicted RNA-binding protein with EMAP domain
MWINKLKIALIEKNTNNIDKLMDEIPQLESLQEIEEVLHLIEEAKSLVEGLKDETSASMKQMKKNINFLKSTQAPLKNKLDMKF